MSYYVELCHNTFIVLSGSLCPRDFCVYISSLVLFLCTGLSMNIFNQWGQYLKFAIPGMLMVCVESWYYELATVAIGTLGSTQLAVISIVKQLQEISYMVRMMMKTSVVVWRTILGTAWNIVCCYGASGKCSWGWTANYFTEDVCCGSWLFRYNHFMYSYSNILGLSAIPM